MQTRHIRLVALGALLSLALGVFAQSGGYPTRARFNSVGVGAAPPAGNGGLAVTTLTATTLNSIAPGDFARRSQLNTLTAAGGTNAWPLNFDSSQPGWFLNETDATTDEKEWRHYVSGGTAVFGVLDDGGNNPTNWLLVDRTGVVINSIAFAGTAMTVNAVDITPSTGTVGAAMADACTTTPTIAFDYQRVGNVVVIQSDTLHPFTECTSDSASFVTTTPPIPAALRPAETVYTAILTGGINNNVETNMSMYITAAGNLGFCRFGTSGAFCNPVAWSATGNKGMELQGISFAYMLGDP